MSRFDDKNVIVTGGTGGIGRAIVRAFLDEGAAVLVYGSDSGRLETLEDEMATASLKTMEVDLRGDVTTLQQRTRQAIEAMGRLHVLVNCAGVAYQTPVLEIDEEQWDQTLTVNLKAAFFLSQEAARHMATAGGGAIVNICSADSFIIESLYADYCAAKAGLAHLTTAMAFELAHSGVRFNGVAPGPTATPMMGFADNQDTYRSYTKTIPMRRFSTPEEQANAVLFLASDEASFVNGETLRVDGGWVTGMWSDPKLEPPY